MPLGGNFTAIIKPHNGNPSTQCRKPSNGILGTITILEGEVWLIQFMLSIIQFICTIV